MLSELRQLTADSADTVRLTGLPLLDSTEAERPATIRAARAVIAQERSFRRTLMQEPWPPGASDCRPDVRQRGEAFDQLCDRLITLVEEGKVVEAIDLRRRSIQSTFGGYTNAIAKAAGTVEEASLKLSDELTVRTGTFSTLVLGIASWPVIVLVVLLLLTAVFVIVLMVLFRGREMSDMP